MMNHLNQPRAGCVWLVVALILAAALIIILATLLWNSPTT